MDSFGLIYPQKRKIPLVGGGSVDEYAGTLAQLQALGDDRVSRGDVAHCTVNGRDLRCVHAGDGFSVWLPRVMRLVLLFDRSTENDDGWVSINSSAANQVVTASHVISKSRHTSATGTNNRSGWRRVSTASGEGSWLLGTDRWFIHRWKVRLLTLFSGARLGEHTIGLQVFVAGSAVQSAFLGLYQDHNSAAWKFAARNASTETPLAVGANAVAGNPAADDQWIEFTMVCNSTIAHFMWGQDQTYIGSIATNLPTVPLLSGFCTTPTGTEAVDVIAETSEHEFDWLKAS